MKFEEREEINRPSSDVYLALSRPDLYLSRWSKGVLSATQLPGQAGAGLIRYKILGRDLAGKVHWQYEVTSYEHGKCFAARATGGPVSFTESFTLRALSEGATEVTHMQEIQPRGLFGLLAPVLPFVWPTLIRKNLSSLKTVLESRKSPVPSVAASS